MFKYYFPENRQKTLGFKAWGRKKVEDLYIATQQEYLPVTMHTKEFNFRICGENSINMPLLIWKKSSLR